MWYAWNAGSVSRLFKNLPTATVPTNEVLTLRSPFFPLPCPRVEKPRKSGFSTCHALTFNFGTPVTSKIERSCAQCQCVTSYRLSRSSRYSNFSQTVPAPCRQSRAAGKTFFSRPANDLDPNGAATRRAALSTMQTFCRFEGVSPPRTVLVALVRAHEYLVAMVRREILKSEQCAAEARQRSSKRSLSTAAEVRHEAVGRPSVPQHELTGQRTEVAGVLSSSVPGPASRRFAQEPTSIHETRLLLLKRTRSP